MTINISAERMKAIEGVGYGLSGDIGGLPRTTYYTPDGRIIKAIPSIREYVIKDKNGKVTASGTRDANLDHGWLLSPPQILKVFCPSCDQWHDTKTEVKACGAKQRALVHTLGVRVKQEEVDKTAILERQVAELTALVEKLMEGRNGHGEVLQSEVNESARQIAGKQSPGKGTKRV